MTTLFRSLLLAGCITPMSLPAQQNPVPPIAKYLAAQIAVNDFSGVVLVSKSGKTIYRQAFGRADREWKIPNSPESKFEIGSLTKQFTAAAILRLTDQHRLSLNDRLSDYFPGYPKGDSITLQMLFNHTSGIANYTEIPGFAAKLTLPLPKDSMIAIFSRQPLTSPPGTKFRYSNSGYWSNAPYLSMEIPFSAGAVISTADDLLTWQNALWAGRIISNASLLEMTTPYLGHYGYALNIDTFYNHRRVWHSGAIPGYTAQSCHFPAEDMTIIVLSNDEGYVGQITDAIASIFFGLPVRMPHLQKETSVQPSVLARYVGKYKIDQTSGTLRFELLVDNGKLCLKPEGANFKMELKPESETLFFLARDHDQELEFVLDKTGNISNCYFTDRDVRLPVTSLP
jgi:CubicO group peptidase (beta-lactamase class C family)